MTDHPQKRSRGRPRKIKSPADLTRMVDEYFEKRIAEDRPITLTGALIHMGIYSRATLDEYEQREGFSEPVKRLRAMVADAYEQRLHGNSPTGAIFALKNMGWKDKTEQDVNHDGSVTYVLDTGIVRSGD